MTSELYVALACRPALEIDVIEFVAPFPRYITGEYLDQNEKHIQAEQHSANAHYVRRKRSRI